MKRQHVLNLRHSSKRTYKKKKRLLPAENAGGSFFMEDLAAMEATCFVFAAGATGRMDKA